MPKPDGVALPNQNATTMDVREVRFSPSGNLIALGTAGGLGVIVDRESRKPIRSFQTRGQLRGITFDANEKSIYLGAGDGFLYKHDLPSGTLTWKAPTVAWPYTPGALAPDGKHIAVGVKTGELTIVDTETGVSSWSALWATTKSADTTTTGDSKYALAADSRIGLVLDATAGEPRATLDTGFADGAIYFKVVYLSKDGSRAVIARRDTVNIAFFQGDPNALK